ncbi:hypothetical protein LEAN103870_02540 [Legionella anisa]|uniref:Uncharacterized protein n=1 Tax=Legionella anisa TaxID=28082 RepID=A0AAX0WTS1_9GAMM|nr:hypothetical protein [Legionella anisa]AWN74320.1 hypothetical protein DLD14_10945 [Legionella anisa]KTC72001.1 Integral membrane protein (PIN domain superfamily) [Legionella anisa]MCW8425643.1 hypothetical protein [Legionella anisa]MCW8448928.1 hypothetical protein [Legionella anisa]PNL61784.1 hypothetical protein A6J39_011505 [Legionella anisa]
MNHSIFLARVMGLSLLILSLSLLINVNDLVPTLTALLQNRALEFIVGMMLVTIGTLLVVSHNVWTRSWVVVITILSWLILIKGILYLMFPGIVQEISNQPTFSKSGIYVACSINGSYKLLFMLYGIFFKFKTVTISA